MEQCAELMAVSTSCEQLGEGIVEESAVRGVHRLLVPAIRHPRTGQSELQTGLLSRATGGTGGGGNLAALWLLSHDTDADAWGAW